MTASSKRWLVVVGALLLQAGPAQAAEPPSSAPPTEAQVEAARALYHDARELHRAGKLEDALDKALAAYRTAPTPVTALEAGELLAELGRLVEARDVVRGVGQLPVSPRESDKGRDARQQAAALAAALDGRIPKVALAGRPAGSTVLLDGKPLAQVEGTAWLGVDPGAHALAVVVEGKACTTIHLALTEGEERTIDLHDATTACRGEGAPAPAPPLPEVTRPAAPAAPTSPPPAPPPEAPPAPASSMRWIGAGVAAAGVVALGVGGALALSAKSRYDSVASECPAAGCNFDGYDTRTSARSRADVATVVLAVGAAAAAGGALLWVLAPSRPVSAGVGPGTVAVRASW
jgi:hypothetical protein